MLYEDGLDAVWIEMFFNKEILPKVKNESFTFRVLHKILD